MRSRPNVRHVASCSTDVSDWITLLRELANTYTKVKSMNAGWPANQSARKGQAVGVALTGAAMSTIILETEITDGHQL